MKVTFRTNKNGIVTGFTLVPDQENPEDVNAINSLRDNIFHNLEESIKYSGRENSTEECAGDLKFDMQK